MGQCVSVCTHGVLESVFYKEENASAVTFQHLTFKWTFRYRLMLKKYLIVSFGTAVGRLAKASRDIYMHICLSHRNITKFVRTFRYNDHSSNVEPRSPDCQNVCQNC
jgi:hypothetical protein